MRVRAYQYIVQDHEGSYVIIDGSKERVIEYIKTLARDDIDTSIMMRKNDIKNIKYAIEQESDKKRIKYYKMCLKNIKDRLKELKANYDRDLETHIAYMILNIKEVIIDNVEEVDYSE